MNVWYSNFFNKIDIILEIIIKPTKHPKANNPKINKLEPTLVNFISCEATSIIGSQKPKMRSNIDPEIPGTTKAQEPTTPTTKNSK